MQEDKKLLKHSDELKKTVVLSSAYLAPVEYYSALAKADRIYIEACDYYVKQSYRNRCRIVTANGVMDLSIPVERPEGNKTLIRDVRISEHGSWQTNHWRAIESAYNSSPFFEYYKDDLLPFYEKKWTFLWDFNCEIQQFILDLLDLTPNIHYSESYQLNYGDDWMDLRETIHPKTEYVREMKPYYQVFQSKFGFLSGMSIIDLIFNMGNESILTLTKLQA